MSKILQNFFSGAVLLKIPKWSFLSILLFQIGCTQTLEETQSKPNIVIFYVDDLGYGDISCYGSTQIQTPNIDKLASSGLKLTDGHSSSATCTPSRYSLLTGEYAFRQKASVLPGDAPLLIPVDKPTLPSMLKESGYKSAMIGKWHLGLGDGNIDWNTAVKPGPLELGFDYSFIIPATGDRVPCVYLENHHVVDLKADDSLFVSYKKKIGKRPTGLKRPDLLRVPAKYYHAQTIINGVSRIGYQAGGYSAEWIDEEFPEKFIYKSEEFINTSEDNPFFLFFSFHDIHVPRLPMDQFAGKSGMGVRGDVILQVDWTVGKVMDILKEKGLAENTLVIFTSDNGPVLTDGYDDEAEMVLDMDTHIPTGPFSGGKYSAFEGGTRVPTIINWPGNTPIAESDALFSQTDIYATVAGLLEHPLEESEAIDSKDLSSVVLKKGAKGRDYMIEESITLSLRNGQWKYIRPTENEAEWIRRAKNIDGGLSKEAQLFDLNSDTTEQVNLAAQFPKKVEEMEQMLSSIESKTQRY